MLERNIQTLLDRRRREEEQKSSQERLVDALTALIGSLPFVYFHLLLFALWILINRGWTPLPRFDPSLVLLALLASVESLLLSTFVLISQNRMAALAEKRAELDVQINLLTEHEVTRLVTLVTAIAAQMGIEAAHDPELADLTLDVAPDQVLDKLEEHEQRIADEK